ncbi:hypothetical protein J3R82DRAFT_2130, partial [Butyriboletus roseoflavus]
VKMNYTNHEHQLIEHYAVTLIGWPVSEQVQNPSKIDSRQEIKKLLNTLQLNSC